MLRTAFWPAASFDWRLSAHTETDFAPTASAAALYRELVEGAEELMVGGGRIELPTPAL